MRPSAVEIARMIDLSCVRTTSSKRDIEAMIAAARQHGFGQVSVLQSMVPFTRHLLGEGREIRLVGNVGFPSGSESTSVKRAQAKELVAAGCDEIDMVMNIGLLRSGEYGMVEEDARAVIAAVQPLPSKIIVESMLLRRDELQGACEICIRAGAHFVKTGSGWSERPTTVNEVRQIKTFVGDHIKIKASGGIRSLATLMDMYAAGAQRFGVNLKSGIEIIREAARLEAEAEV
jgi:deoxyribose-phosphate aldolase